MKTAVRTTGGPAELSLLTCTIRESSGEIRSLDGLRAISILLVIVSHTFKFPEHRPFWFRVAFLHGDLGVRIFFIISGFLITTLLLNERRQFGDVSLKLFYLRRALRILPASLLFIGCVAVLRSFGILQVARRDWLHVLTYTVNFAPVAWPVGHLWSLSVEEQFYFLWPLAMKFARLRTAVGIAILAIFAGIGVRAIASLSGIQLIDPSVHYAFPFVCGPISMGCLLAIGSEKAQRILRGSPFLRRGGLMLLLLPIIAVLDSLDLGTANRFIGVANNSLLTFCVARFVFVPGRMADRFLNSAPMKTIGKLSYSLYLWQQLFFNPWKASGPVWWMGWSGAAACASVSYFGLEQRFMGLRKQFRRRPVVQRQEVLLKIA